MNKKSKFQGQVFQKGPQHSGLLSEYLNDRILTVDAAGRITYISPAAASTLGYDSFQVVGRDLTEFIHPDDLTAASDSLAHIARTPDTPISMELHFMSKNGSWQPLELFCRNLLENQMVNGIVINLLEMDYSITAKHDWRRERNQLRNMLDLYRRAEARIQDIEAFVIEECVNISKSPLCFFGFVNPEETEMMTHLWSEQAMKGCAIDFKPVVFSLSDAGIWAEAIRNREPLIVNDYDQPDPRKKGCPEGHVQIRRLLSIPIIKESKAVAVIAVANKEQEYDETDILHLSLFIESMWDILKRKEAEDRFRKLNEHLEKKVAERTRQLIQTQEQLIRREKLSILGQLAGTVGHELRNPLGVMRNAVYFLKTILPDADDIVKEYLDIINQEVDNSTQIVTDLLDFARTKTPQIDAVQVDALIKQSIDRCRIPEKISITVDIADMLPLASVDQFQMVQVFQNLITNAVQAMPEGGDLSIQACETHKNEAPEGESSDRHVEIRIQDTGSGISPKNREKLFQPLFTTKVKGIGLGLVVCKNLVEVNGGEISVESQVGQGTTFSVVIPIAEESI